MTTPETPEPSRATLRKTMRQARRALPDAERRRAAESLCRVLLKRPELRKARRIALYLANDGELDPAPLARALWRLGKRLYLPVLHPYAEGRLWFAEYRPDSRMRRNRYGIPEPDLRHAGQLKAQALDVVLTPLVAFDTDGNRLGMGGGYYDRTFAFTQRQGAGRRPLMIGVAHEFQRVERLPAQCWDVRLRAIATPTRLYSW